MVAKEADHKYLYDYFWQADTADATDYEMNITVKGEKQKKAKKYHQRYRFMNNVPLNDSNHDIRVNVLYFEETDLETNKTKKWLWITDIEITKDNAKQIMLGGRSRWKVENETFNTLKNQGYNFSHNYGHGYNGLSNVFAALMILAFLIDQVLEATNPEFQKILKKYKSRSNSFEKFKILFTTFMISDFNRLYFVMINGPPEERWL